MRVGAADYGLFSVLCGILLLSDPSSPRMKFEWNSRRGSEIFQNWISLGKINRRENISHWHCEKTALKLSDYCLIRNTSR